MLHRQRDGIHAELVLNPVIGMPPPVMSPPVMVIVFSPSAAGVVP